MKLMTKEIEKALPKLYSTEETPTEEKVVVVKYFCPWNNWTWYAIEGEPEGGDWRFFGKVHGFEQEWGYFMLSELESVTKLGMGIERDLYPGSKKTVADWGIE